jgi:hypothetical protein
LEKYEFDLQEAITGPAAANTPLRPGSEFRPIWILTKIFYNHPLWDRARKTLKSGFTMPLEPLRDVDRVLDVLDALKYGNHKSTQQNPTIVREMLDDEVRHGWQLVLPAESIPVIPGTIVSPLGLVKQNTINEHGETTTKWRLTHDQSFKFQSGTSVNSRVRKERLANCMYGSALRRTLHAIVRYRARFPGTPILMAKFDLKSAYRRAHFSGTSALQSIATSHGLSDYGDNHEHPKQRSELAYVSLRFTFGGSPNPSEFSILSEMIADLANVIIQHKDWDPVALHSTFVNLTGSRPKVEPDDVAFAPARTLLMDWEMSDDGVTDAYIDDIFTVFPFRSEECFQRGRNAALLAIDVLGRPVHPNDPLPRDPIVATKKVMAEGTPSEILTILGWQIDTRRMIIQLPAEKADAWHADLSALISDGDNGYPIDGKRMETIQGRNIHVATMVPGAIHFQSRMYSVIKRAKKYRVTRLKAEERRDLRFLQHLLNVAKRGIDINTVVYRMPDHIGRSDAFEGGIGGFDLRSGRAWRLEIPTDLRNRKSQNFLEYLACMTQLMCMLCECDWKPGDCFLSVGDNISALRWIRKSNFKPETKLEHATHLALARHVTILLAELRVTQFSKWLPGIDNVVADALSREHTMGDVDLTNLIMNSYPSQTPSGFQIKALPPSVSCWALYWLRHNSVTKELPPEPLARATHGGADGSTFYTSASCTTIYTSDSSPNMKDISYLAPSRKRPVTTSGPCPLRDMITWLQGHAAPPSTQFARPSSQPVSTIPARIRTASLRSFYRDSSKGTGIMTRPSSRKRQFHSASSKN